MSNMSEELIKKLTSPSGQRRAIEAVGSSAYALLIAVAKLQRGGQPLEVSNKELMTTLNLSSKPSFIRLRSKCVEAKILEYESRTRQSGIYRIEF